MYHLFKTFINGALANLRRIARATRNEKTVGDLEQDAFLIACEIAENRGYEIDFSDESDQNLVLSYLNHRSVKRGDWKFRRAERIDATEVDDDGEMANWFRNLAAPQTSDPLVQLEAKESPSQLEVILATSYSQAAAYLVILFHFGDRKTIASYLAITVASLNTRLGRASEVVKMQPSLFDRIEKIPSSFLPKQHFPYPKKMEESRSFKQWGWDFAA